MSRTTHTDETHTQNAWHPLQDIKSKLNAKLLEVCHLEYKQEFKEMAQNDLDVRSILESAKDKYNTVSSIMVLVAQSKSKPSIHLDWVGESHSLLHSHFQYFLHASCVTWKVIKD